MVDGGKLTADQKQLVEDHVDLVGAVVNQVSAGFPRYVDRADLADAGTVGLVEAALRWDPTRGVPFAAYAAQRIRGAVIDASRSGDWAPRSVRHEARRVVDAAEHLAARLHQEPTADQLAAELGVTLDELHRLRAREWRAALTRLDATVETAEPGQPQSVADTLPDAAPTADERLELRELAAYVRDAVACLPERQRLAVVGSWFEGRTLEELAPVLGVTMSRVGQIRAEAVERLREGIAAQYAEQKPGRPVGVAARRLAEYVRDIANAEGWRERLST